ncbi:MAG: formate/nitrite transporter family protein [Oscillospiraceae bacterium]|jgi:formate/nitrite transporter|nr:formate/nitrite transporter family protein [Oscillospiraceae bacterium]
MLTSAEILSKWVDTGTAKTKNKPGKLFVLALFAGIFIALAGVAATTAGVSLGSTSYAKLINAVVFPGGLAMVILAGSELFTGNTLILISLVHKKATVAGMLKNWIIVYIGNFIGSVLIAALAVYGHTFSLFGGELAANAVSVAAGKANLAFGDAFIRGILCNFLVCIAVWIASGASTAPGKLMGLFFPIMMFVVSGYEHSVANMYYLPAGLFALKEYGLTAEGLTWGNFLLNNLLPVTLGNILGGGVCVGLGYTLAVGGKEGKAKEKNKK